MTKHGDLSRDELSPRRFEAVLASISDGVFSIDLQGRITCFNRAAQAITGITREEALGKPCRSVFRSDICDEACALRYSIDTGQPVIDLAVRIQSASGEEIPVSISTAIFRDEEGRVVGGVETFRDLRQVEALKKEVARRDHFGEIVTRSEAMRRVLASVATIAESDSSVLITGESGTGKELLARLIHDSSPRSAGPLVAVNCAGIPDTLLEAELFGYERGAFTGAVKAKPGRFALAAGGTLFLDEIGDMPLALQAKLLRILQDGTYEPLGGVRTLKADVRLVASTNRDLPAMIREGTFRQDLYFRINVFELSLPPLRERMEDVPVLVDHFVSRLSALHGRRVDSVSPAALEALLGYRYPGNVRELENAIEHAFVLARGALIRVDNLPDSIRAGAGDDHPDPQERAIPPDGARRLDQLERHVIEAVLRSNAHNRAAAARELGMHKSTLYRKIRKLGITLPEQDGRSRGADLPAGSGCIDP